MDELNIRLASVEDASGIAKVQVEIWQFAYKGQIPQEYLDGLSIEKRTKRFIEILSDRNNPNTTFVAEVDGKIVGFCSIGKRRDEDMPEDTGEIMAIYVDQHFVNQGIGKKLMERSVDYFKKHDYKKAILWVLTTNKKAQQWYEKKGWYKEGKIKEEVVLETPTKDVRYMITL